MSVSASRNRRFPVHGTVSPYPLFAVSAARSPRVVGGTSRFGHPYLGTKKSTSFVCDAISAATDSFVAFILYRQHHQQTIIRCNPGLNNPDISKIIGEKWKAESDEEKKVWQDLALVSTQMSLAARVCKLT